MPCLSASSYLSIAEDPSANRPQNSEEYEDERGWFPDDFPRPVEVLSSLLLDSHIPPEPEPLSTTYNSHGTSSQDFDHMYALPSSYTNKRKCSEPEINSSDQQLPGLSELNSEFESKKPKPAKSYICPCCHKQLSCRQSLYQHKQTRHPGYKAETSHLFHCDRCPNFKYTKVRELIMHCRSFHHEEKRVLYRTFKTEKDFDEWKKETERSYSVKYVQGTGHKKQIKCTVTYYYCSRSGVYRAVTNRKRATKAQGSSKIGGRCTSYLVVRRRLRNGKVDVEYCLDHVPHRVQLGYLKIPDDLRNMIAAKLTQGDKIDNILDDISTSISNEDQDTLVTGRDINNISSQYNILYTQQHANDSQSVELWVHKLKESSNNPVIFYKAQGASHGILHDSDFLLCLQTPFQKETMKKFSTKIIFMDCTYSSAEDELFLTTVFVLDSAEEAVPVAWAISNRKDTEIIQVFLTALKASCDQDFPTDVFLSDLESNLYSAWCEVFSKPQKRLCCSWLIDKRWRRKLYEVIPSKEIMLEIYAFLKIMQKETKKSIFQKMVQDFLKYLTEKAPEYLEYFSSNYGLDDRISLWAGCFQTNSCANANTFRDAFWHVLRDINFNKKQNRRVDHLLIVLLKLARDKEVEKLVNLERGSVNNFLTEIRNQHKDAKNLTGIVDSTVIGGEWCIPCQIISGHQYSVKKVSDCQCKLLCSSCNVCIHMYTCTCPDYLMHTVPCKHIHAVHMLVGLSDLYSDADPDQNETDDPNFFSSLNCQGTSRATESSDIEKMRTAALAKIEELVDLLNTASDLEIIHFVSERLNDALQVAKGMQCTEVEHTSPAGKAFDSQDIHVPTKGRPAIKLNKPSSHD